VPALFAISILVNVGMWSERFLIVVQSMHRDYMPSAWHDFLPTAWDWTHLFGSIAFFAFLFLLFVRLLPSISIAEMRKLVRESAEYERGPGA
jgi:molybdopterin-containing oxidoreductase family membrane subunit